MALIRSMVSVGIYSIFCRLTGFFRDILMASLIGAGFTMDALVIAIKIPSFLRRIFAEGAFNASFVPLFNELLHKKSRHDALLFSHTILSFLFFSLSFIIIIFEIWMPVLLPFIVPGFENEVLELAITLNRVTFPFALLISLAAFFSGILNTLERFDAAASSAMAGNLFIIACLLFVDSSHIVSGKPVAFAILGSGIIQMIWVLVPCLWAGIPLKLQIPHFSPPVKRFLKRFVPGALGSGVFQIQLFVGLIIGSLLPSGTMSYLHYADRLHQLPISVIGGAISTALLPTLARQCQQGDLFKALTSQNRAIQFSLLLSLPFLIVLTFLSKPLIFIVFHRGAFTMEAVQQTAYTLSALSLGLPAYILIKVFNTTFFSRQDTVTPLKVAGLSVSLDLIFNLFLMKTFKHVGIALSTALSAWISVILLLFLLHKKGYFKPDEELKSFLKKILWVVIFTILSLLFISFVWGGFFSLERGSIMIEIAHVSLLLGIGGAVFFFMARSLGCTKFNNF